MSSSGMRIEDIPRILEQKDALIVFVLGLFFVVSINIYRFLMQSKRMDVDKDRIINFGNIRNLEVLEFERSDFYFKNFVIGLLRGVLISNISRVYRVVFRDENEQSVVFYICIDPWLKSGSDQFNVIYGPRVL